MYDVLQYLLYIDGNLKVSFPSNSALTVEKWNRKYPMRSLYVELFNVNSLRNAPYIRWTTAVPADATFLSSPYYFPCKNFQVCCDYGSMLKYICTYALCSLWRRPRITFTRHCRGMKYDCSDIFGAHFINRIISNMMNWRLSIRQSFKHQRLFLWIDLLTIALVLAQF